METMTTVLPTFYYCLKSSSIEVDGHDVSALNVAEEVSLRLVVECQSDDVEHLVRLLHRWHWCIRIRKLIVREHVQCLDSSDFGKGEKHFVF